MVIADPGIQIVPVCFLNQPVCTGPPPRVFYNPILSVVLLFWEVHHAHCILSMIGYVLSMFVLVTKRGESFQIGGIPSFFCGLNLLNPVFTASYMFEKPMLTEIGFPISGDGFSVTVFISIEIATAFLLLDGVNALVIEDPIPPTTAIVRSCEDVDGTTHEAKSD